MLVADKVKKFTSKTYFHDTLIDKINKDVPVRNFEKIDENACHLREKKMSFCLFLNYDSINFFHNLHNLHNLTL